MYIEEALLLRWRVGRKLGRTVYVMKGSDPSDEDEFIGVMDTTLLAKHVVEAHNYVLDVGV